MQSRLFNLPMIAVASGLVAACNDGSSAATLSQYACNDRDNHTIEIIESQTSSIELRATGSISSFRCTVPGEDTGLLGANRCEVTPETAQVFTLRMSPGSSGEWIQTLHFNRGTGLLRRADSPDMTCALIGQHELG